MCVYYSLADEAESIDITLDGQMCIAAHGITHNFKGFKEFATIHSLQRDQISFRHYSEVYGNIIWT
jgi:hypothetical protein